MARRILQNIQVLAGGGGSPEAFHWHGRTYHISDLLEQWKESGCWWDGEPARIVYRVKDDSGKTFELHRLKRGYSPARLAQGQSAKEADGGRWLLYSIED